MSEQNLCGEVGVKSCLSRIKEEITGDLFDLQRGWMLEILGSVIDLRSLKIRPEEILTP